MALEALCRERAQALQLPLIAGDILRTDWAPLLDLCRDENVDPSRRAEIVHASMAQALLDQAIALRERHGIARVGLSGGVFQNRFLTEHVMALLAGADFDVFLPLALPCNDAALSFGQAAEVAARHHHG